MGCGKEPVAGRLSSLHRMGVNRSFKGDEQYAVVITHTLTNVWQLWWTVGVHAGIEHHRLLAVVLHLKSALNQHHPFSRTVPVMRQDFSRRNFEEYV